jgi:hypothetical protein
MTTLSEATRGHDPRATYTAGGNPNGYRCNGCSWSGRTRDDHRQHLYDVWYRAEYGREYVRPAT